MLERRWLAAATAGWLLINLTRAGTVVESGEELLRWMLIQQVWLTGGSWLAVRQAGILRWEARDAVRGVFAGMGLFLANTVLNLAVVAGLNLIFPQAQVQQWLTQERRGINMLLGIENAPAFWLAAAAITIGASVSEELFFRGAILTALAQAVPAKGAVVLASLVFAVVHFYLIQFIPVMLSGVVLGYLYLKNKNLTSAIAAHMVVNTLAFIAHIL